MKVDYEDYSPRVSSIERDIPSFYNNYYPNRSNRYINNTDPYYSYNYPRYDSYSTPRYYNYPSYNRKYPYYPTARTIYPLARYPNVPHHYRYNVLPYFGHNANDYLRNYRRKSRTSTLGTYYTPPISFYSNLRQNIRSVRDKMDSHKTLLDRYSTIDMAPGDKSVVDNINEKSIQFSHRKRM